MKPHGNTGKRHAAKVNPKTALITLRVTEQFKLAATRRAIEEKTSLAQYIHTLIEQDQKL